MDIVLASTSPARQQQMQQLGIDFLIAAPNIDETPLDHENAHDLVKRLALAKAYKVSRKYPDALIIAGDQVGVNQGKILGKPLTETNAIEQLQAASGKTLRFHSGLSLLNARSNKAETVVVTTDVTFRKLDLTEIIAYVKRAQPLNCAGSFNIDGLGITLFTRVDSEDPSALLGLPLIALTSLLKQQNISLP